MLPILLISMIICFPAVLSQEPPDGDDNHCSSENPCPLALVRPDGDDNHCSSAKPCPLGEGDCDSDDECQGDLVCGYKNCDGSQYGANDDCCKGGYILGTTLKNWEDARTDCQTANADLVTINSATEQNYLRDLIKAQGNTSASYWIGYHDKVTEGTFVWATGGSSFTNWNTDEPTNSSGVEDCTVVDPSAGYKWKDSSCTATVPYICEKYLDKPTVTVTPSSVVDEATAVNLSCSATASGNITYSWKKAGQSYNSSSRIFNIANGSNIDSGSYVCIVSTELGTKYSTALQVYFRYLDKPAINGKPTTPLKEGSSITLFCISNGYPTVSYNWYRNGSFLMSSSSYIIASLNRLDTGNYTCQASNSFAKKTSDEVQVTVAYLDTPVTAILKGKHHIGTMVDEGSVLNLTCSADGSEPLKYTWTKDSHIFESTEGKISVPALSRSHTGSYVCTVVNSYGEKQSSARKIVVRYMDKPVISGKQQLTAKEGTNLFLSCSTKGYPEVTYKWKYNGQFLQNGSTLVIQNLKRQDSGSYICTAINEFKTMESSPTVLNVTYLDTPLTAILEAAIETALGSIVDEGSYLNLTCSANGSEPLTYSWRKDSKVFYSAEGKISIPTLSRSHTGSYVCTAVNNYGEKRSSAKRIIVRYMDKPVISGKQQLTTKEGTNLFLSCSTEGYPEVTYKWKYNGQFLQNGSTLVIQNLKKQDSGSYICIAVNDLKTSESSPTVLNVTYLDSPIVAMTPSTNVNESSTLILTCSANGSSFMTYSWTKDGKDYGSSSSQLIILNTSRTDAGYYMCTVSSDFGTKRSYAKKITISYLDKPIIAGNPPAEIKEGSSVSMFCSSIGYPQATYRWYKNGSFLRTSSSYVIGTVRRTDYGNYTCEANNAFGTKTSEAAQWKIAYLDSPVVAVTPNTTVNESSPLTLTCFSMGSGSLTHTWTKDGKSDGWSSSQISIVSASRGDAGNYVCTVTNNFGVKHSTVYKIVVNYLDKPIITGNPLAEIKEGSSMTMFCSSIGYPQATYRWYKNGSFVRTSSSYVIGTVRRTDYGNYTCKANNAFGTKTSEAAQWNIAYLDSPVVVVTPSTTVNESSPLTFTCSSIGSGSLAYTWTKDGKSHRSSTSQISIVSASRGDAGNYMCTVTNNFGAKHSTVYKIVVNYMDRPVINGKDKVIAKEGTNLFLSCSTKGYPQVNYHWKRDGQFFKNMTSIITIRNLKREDSGSYTCVTTNQMTEMESAPTVVNVTYLNQPSVTANPSSVIKEGSDVSFTCNTQSNPSVSYSWKKDGYQTVANGKILSFNNTLRSKAGLYTCLTSNSMFQKRSSNVKLDIQYLDQPVINPQYSFPIKENETVTYNCYVTSNPMPTYKWYQDGSMVKTGMYFLDRQPIHRSHAGKHICSATNPAGTKNSTSFTVTVWYLDKPVMSNTGTGVRNEGSPATLRCTAVGQTSPKYKWYKNTTTLMSSRNGVLNFKSLHRTDTGNYTCHGENTFGVKFSDTTSITVRYLDQPTTDVGRNLIIEEGLSKDINCSAVSFPDATYTWHNLNTFEWMQNGTVLSFTNVRRSQIGYYICNATNPVGEKQSIPFKLNVTYIEVPEVQFKMKSHDKQMRNNTTMNNNGTMDGNMTNNLSTINVTDVSNRTNSSSNKSLSDVQMYHINEGESANLSCSAISNPVAKFRWNKNINETYREGNIILFNNITREDAGLYVCTAFNMVKYRTSAASRIVVRYLDKPSIISPNITLFQEYSKIVMKCSVVALPSANFSWQINGTKTSYNSDTLIINNSRRYDSGIYECMATNGFKMMKSHPFYLEVNSIQCPMKPCLNRGTCEIKKGIHTCICQHGFYGKLCEIREKTMYVEHRINAGWEDQKKMPYYLLRIGLKDPKSKMYTDISADLLKGFLELYKENKLTRNFVREIDRISFRTTPSDVFVSYVVDLEKPFSQTMANVTESFESTLKMKDYKVHCSTCRYVMEITQKSASFSDFNDCTGNRHACAKEAICSNDHLTYTCTCQKGYVGDGIFCNVAEKQTSNDKSLQIGFPVFIVCLISIICAVVLYKYIRKQRNQADITNTEKGTVVTVSNPVYEPATELK